MTFPADSIEGASYLEKLIAGKKNSGFHQKKYRLKTYL